MKKTAAIILALIILVSAAACGQKPASTPAATPTATPTAAQSATPTPGADVTPTATPMKVSIKKEIFEDDTEMFSVGGEPIYWSEVFYWTMQNIINLTGGGILDDWNVEYSEGVTVQQVIKDKVVEYAAFYRSMETKAKEAGIEFTQDDQDDVDAQISEYVTYLGGEEALEQYMQKNYLTTDMYKAMLRFGIINDRLFAKMFGENGSKCSDEDTIAFGEECGIVNVKHILLLTKDKTEEEKAAVLKTITGYLDEINAAGDKGAKFDELMKAHSEDTGLAASPNGYQYEPNTMVEVFETAAAALKPGEVSAVVESSYGYHIIMRLPIAPDSGIVGDSYGNTLRYYAAYEQYSNLSDSWYDESKVTLGEAFKNFSLNDLFEMTPEE